LYSRCTTLNHENHRLYHRDGAAFSAWA
jgi:hypothetical protein